ncbi:MAG: sigma-70 family RNA polymerase sigma factor, partial [Ignavibacteriales bacterium]
MALKQESKLIQSHISEVRSGKSAAYEQLYNVHAGRIYTFGLKFFNHSKYGAEELTKRVFITAFEQINSYPQNITFILWLQKFAVEELRKGDIQKGDEIHQVSPVDEAVFLLPEEERIIFILSDIEKLNTEEMVEVVPEPVESISAKLDSARKRMLEKLNVNNLTELDYKVNFVSKKPEPRDELWDIIYNHIHFFATKDLKEDTAGEVLN